MARDHGQCGQQPGGGGARSCGGEATRARLARAVAAAAQDGAAAREAMEVRAGREGRRA
jgi:hypothetical protein